MYWQEVCEHPNLKDLPFKIELNESEKIIMSFLKVYHSIYQGRLSTQLYSQKSLKGKLYFYNHDGKLKNSLMATNFPKNI